MAENSIIEWTKSTFNPWIGCTRVSPGCDGCYAAVSTPARSMKIEWGAGKPRHRTSPSTWSQVRRWNAKAAATGEFWPVFTASLADVFDNEVPAEWRAELWALIRECPHLTFQIVTKRIGNARRMLPPDWGDGYPNVWLLITVVTQEEADRDIPKLLRIPARIHGLSMEPLLEPVIVPMSKDGDAHGRKIDWIIAGGESGSAARPLHPEWMRSLRDQCRASGAAFFFKRWGEWQPAQEGAGIMPPGKEVYRFADGSVSFRMGKKASGRTLDGRTWDEQPVVQ